MGVVYRELHQKKRRGPSLQKGRRNSFGEQMRGHETGKKPMTKARIKLQVDDQDFFEEE